MEARDMICSCVCFHRAVLRRHDPHVSELHGVVAALKDDRSMDLALVPLVLDAGRFFDLHILVD